MERMKTKNKVQSIRKCSENCVTEHHYVFSTRVYGLYDLPCFSETQNPRISGFQSRMRVKTKQNEKQKAETRKTIILLISHQSTFYIPEKHSKAYRP